MLLPLWSDRFSTLVFASRLRFGDSFPLAFEHHFAFKLSDPAPARACGHQALARTPSEGTTHHLLFQATNRLSDAEPLYRRAPAMRSLT
jgi:hypothetical protein